MAIEDNDQDSATEILNFVLQNTRDLDLLIQSHYYLIEMKIDHATEKDYPIITAELDKLIKEFGVSPYTLSLLKLQADFNAFHLNNPEKAKAILKSTFLKETPTEAIFTCEYGVIKINTRFHQPTTITLEQNGIEEHLDFSAETFGYNFEIEHFNQLLRDNKKESELMSFSFSKDLIATLDSIRKNINLKY